VRLALIAVVALALAACTSESDTPDVDTVVPSNTVVITHASTTVPPFADCSSESPVDPCVTPSDVSVSEPAPSSTVSEPPVTCGPDPDETHPPPCD